MAPKTAALEHIFGMSLATLLEVGEVDWIGSNDENWIAALATLKELVPLVMRLEPKASRDSDADAIDSARLQSFIKKGVLTMEERKGTIAVRKAAIRERLEKNGIASKECLDQVWG